jgi:hypothetical protein
MRYGAEIKFTFSAGRAADAAKAFGLRVPEAVPMEIHFLDMLDAGKNPILLGLGVVLRVRGHHKGAGDCTAKLRPLEDARLTGRWRREANQDNDFRVEYDWARQPVLSASLGAPVRTRRLAAVLAGARPVQQAFTERQRKFLRDCGPDLDVPFHGLRVAGPIAALRWDKVAPIGSNILRAEQWTWGDGNTFLEFSLRVDDFADAEALRNQLAADFEDRALKPDPASMTKTEAVLRDLLSR